MKLPSDRRKQLLALARHRAARAGMAQQLAAVVAVAGLVPSSRHGSPRVIRPQADRREPRFRSKPRTADSIFRRIKPLPSVAQIAGYRPSKPRRFALYNAIPGARCILAGAQVLAQAKSRLPQGKPAHVWIVQSKRRRLIPCRTARPGRRSPRPGAARH